MYLISGSRVVNKFPSMRHTEIWQDFYVIVLSFFISRATYHRFFSPPTTWRLKGRRVNISYHRDTQVEVVHLLPLLQLHRVLKATTIRGVQWCPVCCRIKIYTTKYLDLLQQEKVNEFLERLIVQRSFPHVQQPIQQKKIVGARSLWCATCKMIAPVMLSRVNIL